MGLLEAPAGGADASDAGSARGARPRPRRLRRSSAMRSMLAETTLGAQQLIHPLFVRAGRGVERPIDSMPGHAQRSVDRLGAEVDEVSAIGLRSVLLFGLPDTKDPIGSAALNLDGIKSGMAADIQHRRAAQIFRHGGRKSPPFDHRIVAQEVIRRGLNTMKIEVMKP